MVSSSRKKSRGRDRKAKKKAYTVEAERVKAHALWLRWAKGDEKFVGKHIECNHGCVVLPDYDHPVSIFMNHLFTQDRREWCVILYKFQREAVLNDERYREMVTQILIRIGANMLLNGTEVSLRDTLVMAKTINVLEHYDTGMDDSIEAAIHSRVVATKLVVLKATISGRQDALKFFAKRVSCSCLKAMHQEARKTIPKTGKCRHCNEQKERVALSVCSRCMIVHYCSRECQVADWSEHKMFCDQLARYECIKQQQTKT